MSSFGTCKLCGEKISYNPDNIHFYGAHLIEKHPEVDFAHFALIYEPLQNKAQCVCGSGSCAQNTSCLKSQKAWKRSVHYKTTIKSFKCSPIPQNCPRCGKTNTPIIKRQRSKLTPSSTLACFLLGCWPFCFLPFIISGSDLFYLYCKDCGYYIGVYDRRVSTSTRHDGAPCGCR